MKKSELMVTDMKRVLISIKQVHKETESPITYIETMIDKLVEEVRKEEHLIHKEE